MKTKCRDCGEFKIRRRSTRKRQTNRFYYEDGAGRMWNGHQCPQCKVPKASGNRSVNHKNMRETNYDWIEDHEANPYENCVVDDAYIYC